MNLETITTQEATQRIFNILKDYQKKHSKLKDIEQSGDDTVTFKYGKIYYFVFVDDPDNVKFTPNGFDYGGKPELQNDYGASIWEEFEQYGEWNLIEDYFESTVVPNQYEYIVKVWSTFEKLDNDSFHDELVTKLAAKYFGLTE